MEISWEKELGPCENWLCHYTSMRAFHSIFQGERAPGASETTRYLWATDIRYLNDSTEFALGLEATRKALEPHRTGPKATIVGKLLAHDNIEEVLTAVSSEHAQGAYVVSFSQRADDLAQWRGYTPRDCGVCIVFDKSEMEQRLARGPWSLRQCQYLDPNGSLDWLANLLLEGFVEDPPKAWDAWRFVWRTCASTFCKMKHRGFASEQEVRLVCESVERSSLCHRPSNSGSMLLPYVKFRLGQFPPVLGVIVGPSPHMKLSLASVQSFLDTIYANAADDVVRPKAVPSQIPFRPL